MQLWQGLSKLNHTPPAVFKPHLSPSFSIIRSRSVSQLLQRIWSLREMLTLMSESYESVLVLRERKFASLLPGRNLSSLLLPSWRISTPLFMHLRNGAMTSERFAIYSGAPSLRWFATTGGIPSMNNSLGSALLVLSQDSIPEVAERKPQSLCYDATVETD
jgi:hypothetical protein